MLAPGETKSGNRQATRQLKSRLAKVHPRRKAMSLSVNAAADAVLNRVVSSTPGVPGVVAIVTDRSHNTYEGVAGKRKLGARNR